MNGLDTGHARPGRTLHVEHCMGTVVGIDIRDRGSWDTAIGEVIRWLHRVDTVLSTYQHGSDISRLSRGEIDLTEADPMVTTVLELCADVQRQTGGYFTARPAEGLDPTGLVKGWAIEEASAILRAHGSTNHAVNGGGDIQLAGEAGPGAPWRIGIADPRDRSRTLTTVTGRDVAIATSGSSERGEHIIDPFTGRAPLGLASVTVLGASLTLVDAYATAGYAMGVDALRWLSALPGHHAMVVDNRGTVTTTPQWLQLLTVTVPTQVRV